MNTPLEDADPAVRAARKVVAAATAARAERTRNHRIFLWAMSHAIATPVLRLTKQYSRLDETFEPGGRARRLVAARDDAIAGLRPTLREAHGPGETEACDVLGELVASIPDGWLEQSADDERWALMTGGGTGFILLVAFMILSASFFMNHVGTDCLVVGLVAVAVEVALARHALMAHPDTSPAPGMTVAGHGVPLEA